MTSSTAIRTPLEAKLPSWQPATWQDYLAACEDPTLERVRLFFDRGYLLIQMGAEGINHSRISDLLTMLFCLWFLRKPEQSFSSLGRCLIEQPPQGAAAPDQVLYIGEGTPRCQEGEPRRIDLRKWRVPDLVGEVADMTLATDLDEKKQIYAALEIPEYWVTNVRDRQVLAFRLQDDGKYQQCEYSVALAGLPISLLEETLQQLDRMDNGMAAVGFAQQIANL